jgi:phosphoglycolate phosphatase (TIGR01487 family)
LGLKVITLRGLRVLFLDVDGTLTVDRYSYDLHLGAVEALRRAVRAGVIVSLVSSNALPIVVGLSRYIGLNGPVIGESGGLVYHDEWGLVDLGDKPGFEPYRAVLREFSDCVEDSWQNRFRFYDLALKVKRTCRSRERGVFEDVKRFVESYFPGFTAEYSGYAIHIHSVSVSKRRAVLYVLERLSVKPEEAGGVGDSLVDASFLSVLGYSAAVSNADEELKMTVRFNLSSPSGLGVVEFIERVLSGLL